MVHGISCKMRCMRQPRFTSRTHTHISRTQITPTSRRPHNPLTVHHHSGVRKQCEWRELFFTARTSRTMKEWSWRVTASCGALLTKNDSARPRVSTYMYPHAASDPACSGLHTPLCLLRRTRFGAVGSRARAGCLWIVVVERHVHLMHLILTFQGRDMGRERHRLIVEAWQRLEV